MKSILYKSAQNCLKIIETHTNNIPCYSCVYLNTNSVFLQTHCATREQWGHDYVNLPTKHVAITRAATSVMTLCKVKVDYTEYFVCICGT